MQLLEHYFRLYGLWKHRTGGSPGFIEITVPELSAWFHCTERNAKLLIKAMQRQQWLVWQPGQGRGHRSQLSCRAVPDSLMASYARELLYAGEVQEAVKLMQSPFLSEEGREHLLYMIRCSFASSNQEKGSEQGPRSTLRFPSYRQPGRLDPAYATRRTELHWIRQLFDTLVEYDSQQDVYVSGLAHAWESDLSARHWRFYIQKRVHFHHGAAFTSEDVRFTLHRLTASDKDKLTDALSPYRHLFAGLEQVVCIHDHLVELIWKESCRPCLSLLALSAASMIPAELTGDWPMKPIGTGPFMLTHRDERLLRVEANPYYYKRAAHLECVEMWCLPEIYEQGHLKELGELEMGGMNFGHTWGSPLSDSPWSRLERTDRGCKYVLVNQAKEGPLQELTIREVVYGVIREGNAMEELGGNRGERADSFIRDFKTKMVTEAIKESAEAYQTEASPAEWKSAGASQTEVNLSGGESAGANQKEANPSGWESAEASQTEAESTGMSLVCGKLPSPYHSTVIPPLQLVTYAGAGHERDAVWLQRELENCGIPVYIRTVEYDRLLHPDTLDKADLLLLEQPIPADEEAALWVILASEQSPLRSCLTKERLQRMDARLAELSSEASRSERLYGLGLLEQELLAERSIIVWYRWRQSALFPAALQGVKIGPLGWVDYKDLWFKE